VLHKGLHYLGNNALGALALFVALGGTTYAATGGFTGPGGKLSACVNGNGTLTLLKAGRSCHRGQKKIGWNQTGPRGPQGATGPSGIAGLNGAPVPSATNATTATTALTANNALALGGTPASGFTHNDCVSETGQVKGFALIPANAGFSPSFAKVDATVYNCSGEAVEARRTATGKYVVRFAGNPAAIALGTANTAGIDNVSVLSLAPGEWEVKVLNIPEDKLVDEPFELLVP
jgi:hypothetical protein